MQEQKTALACYSGSFDGEHESHANLFLSECMCFILQHNHDNTVFI